MKKKKIALGEMSVNLRKEFKTSVDDLIKNFNELSIEELYVTVTLNNGEVHRIPAFYPDINWTETIEEDEEDVEAQEDEDEKDDEDV